MASGRAPRAQGHRATRLLIAELARELGVPSGHMLLNGCDDPRILRTAIALFRSGGSISDAVAETGESDAFVRRIREVHMRQNAERPWRREPIRLRSAFYEVASQNEGLVTAADLMGMGATESLGQVYNVVNDYKYTSSRWTSERRRGYRLAPCSCGSIKAFVLSIP